MLLLKVIPTFLNTAFLETIRQTQADIKKHGGGTMMLLIVMEGVETGKY